jgi:hypothetical protein
VPENKGIVKEECDRREGYLSGIFDTAGFQGNLANGSLQISE